MSIALWQEVETLKRRVAQLESLGAGDGSAILERLRLQLGAVEHLADRLTALEQRRVQRKPGRPAKTKEHPQ